ncbi:TPA: hypothetical protein NY293_005209 [Escherichia coli]|uniref:Uncharacterized protein n=1 Tax=Escherichia coli TaxID=562 RepID=A0A828MN18_ECOLX|nr:hypothetical protein [Escherichia coli]EFA4158462.1 hypothetical protein [Escherichia coli O174:H7]EFE9630443.1 hypothetical protein [Escherichia coli]EFM0171564.1 hypothetical protein [Escherichia coli]EFM0187152.1 hypothetical protein [Escherichia coli]
MTNQQVTELEIAYGGEAYANNEIDAKTLGDALSSLSNLIDNAEKIIHGETASAHVSIKAIQEGSFTVLVSVLGSLSTLQLLGLSAAAGAGAGSLVGVVEWLRGRKPHEVVIDEANNRATFVVDNERFECSNDVQKLVTNPVIRNEMSKLVHNPLQTEKSALFKVKSSSGDEVVTISQEQSVSFKKVNHTVVQHTHEEALTLNVKFSKLSFTSETDWRMVLPDGDDVKVKMADAGFLERVNLNKTSFSKDDLFVVNVTKTVKETNGVFGAPAYTITQVVRHRAAAERRIV